MRRRAIIRANDSSTSESDSDYHCKTNRRRMSPSRKQKTEIETETEIKTEIENATDTIIVKEADTELGAFGIKCETQYENREPEQQGRTRGDGHQMI